MVLIIHGFPNEISALKFEWAWQKPKKSRRLKHLQLKKTKESSYEFELRILNALLLSGPWCRLPLTIRWLKDYYIRHFPVTSQPPLHMPIAYGRVAVQKLVEHTEKEYQRRTCHKCFSNMPENDLMTCVNPKCNVACHVVCFSTYFATDDQYLIPIDGKCPRCNVLALWGDLVRKKNGCYKNLTELDIDSNISESEDMTEDL